MWDGEWYRCGLESKEDAFICLLDEIDLRVLSVNLVMGWWNRHSFSIGSTHMCEINVYIYICALNGSSSMYCSIYFLLWLLDIFHISQRDGMTFDLCLYFIHDGNTDNIVFVILLYILLLTMVFSRTLFALSSCFSSCIRSQQVIWFAGVWGGRYRQGLQDSQWDWLEGGRQSCAACWFCGIILPDLGTPAVTLSCSQWLAQGLHRNLQAQRDFQCCYQPCVLSGQITIFNTSVSLLFFFSFF